VPRAGVRAAKASPVELSDDDLRAQYAGLLQASKGNVAEVARATGQHRELVYRALRRLDLDPARFRGPGGEGGD
jgi:transcriptional regulator of acetoin/glycerol metabolism